ncbi:AraC family transcriptional regulator [Rossellomorea sp. AcN35-11]|nr:AraC family transcriptional regulator [Rossellomorea aquimaris]NMH69285.1 AraC family transcriptional regulator [Bacillus sp. RO3]WJV29503.1 AraC family transcriptional regulator [Rossellomorea sp. AcN35-11]
MEMLYRLNECIQYIENNLEGDIDMNELARLSFSSKFHFQRLFSLVTGYTVSDYIRKRRLTLAAQELINGDVKVIDVAYKHGYETPESFSKAFRKAHGVSPSKVKEPGTTLRAFPRISFQIQLKGEVEMDYKIVDKEAFHVIGKGKRVSTANGQNTKDIPLFWDEVNSTDLDKKMCDAAGNDEMVGICMEFDHPNEEFTYFIGAEEKSENEHTLEGKDIPAATWAVFESIGPMPHAIQAVWKRIFSEWFPSTGYEHAGGPEFELYPPGNPNDENYRCEIWIPIMKK